MKQTSLPSADLNTRYPVSDTVKHVMERIKDRFKESSYYIINCEADKITCENRALLFNTPFPCDFEGTTLFNGAYLANSKYEPSILNPQIYVRNSSPVDYEVVFVAPTFETTFQRGKENNAMRGGVFTARTVLFGSQNESNETYNVVHSIARIFGRYPKYIGNLSGENGKDVIYFEDAAHLIDLGILTAEEAYASVEAPNKEMAPVSPAAVPKTDYAYLEEMRLIEIARAMFPNRAEIFSDQNVLRTIAVIKCICGPYFSYVDPEARSRGDALKIAQEYVAKKNR